MTSTPARPAGAPGPGLFDLPIPDTDPEIVPLAREDLSSPMTEFEQVLYAMSYQQPDRAKALMARYFEVLPDYTGEPDDRDLWHPDATGPIPIPRHWRTTPVHLLPGGFGNDRTLRMTILGKRVFYYTQERHLEPMLQQVHGPRRPRRILDVGCGTATTTFTYARLFPEAQVTGIDLSAPYLRWDREQAAAEGLDNLAFYQDNAEASLFPDASFDTVHFTYVLHEMPRANARRVLAECYRLLEPGGVLSVMEAQCFGDQDVLLDKARRGRKIEPFLQEYIRLDLPRALEQAGFQDLQVHETNPQGVFLTVRKPA